MFIDSHCHLNFPEFKTDLNTTIERAKDIGIDTMVTICTKLEEFSEVLAIAEANDQVFCSVGVHPHHVEECEQATFENLLKLANSKCVIGFGETGLDFYYQNSSRLSQETSFRAHIAASRSSGFPVIVHSRNADEDTIRILRDEYRIGPFSGVIHCFSSGLELANVAIELGFYISISGIITFKTADILRDIVSFLPIERLLIETDSPYLAPVPNRGKRNEPAFVLHIAKKVAELKKVELFELGRITSENFHQLFKRVKSRNVV